MGEKKYHIGKNGPAPCGANPDKPGGRACRFGEARHGTEVEMISLWDREQEELHGDALLSGASRASFVAEMLQRGDIPADPSLDEYRYASIAQRTLSNPSKYRARLDASTSYGEEEVSVAMNLAAEQSSALSTTEIRRLDRNWMTSGCTKVRRYELQDGSVGYFKSFADNSLDERAFKDYGTSSLTASVNEVNAHRMAQLLGKGFDELVPETSLREAEGDIGSIQREVFEVKELNQDFREGQELQDDCRKAAIFDFVIGNLDRHGGNFLYGAERNEHGELRNRVRLIDNSFSFPADLNRSLINSTLFADNDGADSYIDSNFVYQQGYQIPESELGFTDQERAALKSARAGVQEWMGAGTIGRDQGRATIERIDYLLLDADRISNFTSYYYSIRGSSRNSEEID